MKSMLLAIPLVVLSLTAAAVAQDGRDDTPSDRNNNIQNPMTKPDAPQDMPCGDRAGRRGPAPRCEIPRRFAMREQSADACGGFFRRGSGADDREI
jgi:hypothetical protein